MLGGDFVARQFFDCLLGPIRCNGDPQVSLVSRLGLSHEVGAKEIRDRVPSSGTFIPKEQKKIDLHVTKSHHADGLPDTQANTGCHTAVQTLDTVRVVDVLESFADSKVLGAVGVLSLALHLNPDHFDRLVPG